MRVVRFPRDSHTGQVTSGNGRDYREQSHSLGLELMAILVKRYFCCLAEWRRSYQRLENASANDLPAEVGILDGG